MTKQEKCSPGGMDRRAVRWARAAHKALAHYRSAGLAGPFWELWLEARENAAARGIPVKALTD
jgi:hypothetical protein